MKDEPTYKVPWLHFPSGGNKGEVEFLPPCQIGNLAQELAPLHSLSVAHLCAIGKENERAQFREDSSIIRVYGSSILKADLLVVDDVQIPSLAADWRATAAAAMRSPNIAVHDRATFKLTPVLAD